MLPSPNTSLSPASRSTGCAGLKRGVVVGAGPVIFGLLHVERRLREHLDIADVVGMRMRDRHRLDVGGLDAELLELALRASSAASRRRLRIGRRKPVRHRGDGIGNAGVPQEPALAVLDEIAGVDEIHRLAFVHAGRPARNVAGDALAAIDDVEFLDARLLRERSLGGQRECGNGKRERDLGHDLAGHPWSFLAALLAATEDQPRSRRRIPLPPRHYRPPQHIFLTFNANETGD